MKRMKARHEKENADGDIPITLLVYFGLDEEHRDTRARIALLVPPPAPRGLFPHISAAGGQGVGNRED